MKSRHWVTLVVLATGVVLLAGIFLRLKQADGEVTEDEPATAEDSVRSAVLSTAAAAAFAPEVVVPVEAEAVRRDTFVVWIEASGRAAALREAPLAAEVAGAVVEAPLREGAIVREGDPLARIDPAPYEINVRRAEADVDRATAEFQNLTLFDDDIEEETVRAERRRQARIRSGLTAAEANLEEARYELAKTVIHAPFGGRVANLVVVEGTRLRVGDSVATVVDLSRIDVDADVLETELPYVATGRDARITFPALPGEVFRGRVATINPIVSRETNTARVTVRLSNSEARVVPGMHGNLQIAGRLLVDRTFVPKVSIVERDRREVVFVFEPDEPGGDTGTAKWKYVRTGIESDRYVEILSDPETDELLPGEIVLTDGHTTLIHDARVRIENLEESGGDK